MTHPLLQRPTLEWTTRVATTTHTTDITTRNTTEQRFTFDRIAELYDACRPSYPRAFVDDLVSLSGLPMDGRILEIGSGTGKATALLASLDRSIVGLELVPSLAAIARENLRDFPKIEMVGETFEDWTHTCTGIEYLGLLQTHSDHQMLPSAQLDRLLASIGELIRSSGNRIELSYETHLYLATRLPREVAWIVRS